MQSIYELSTVAETYRAGMLQANPLLQARVDLTEYALRNELLHGGTLDVLDVGCGAGAIIDNLDRLFQQDAGRLVFTGVDQAERQVALARRDLGHRGHRFEVADVHALPFEANAFDVVFETRMFQFLQNPLRALAEMTRVSRSLVIVSLFSAEERQSSFHPFSCIVRAAPDGGLETNSSLIEMGTTEVHTHLLVQSERQGEWHYPYCKHRRTLLGHADVAAAVAHFPGKVLYSNEMQLDLDDMTSPDATSGPTGAGDRLRMLPAVMTTLVLKKQVS